MVPCGYTYKPPRDTADTHDPRNYGDLECSDCTDTASFHDLNTEKISFVGFTFDQNWHPKTLEQSTVQGSTLEQLTVQRPRALEQLSAQRFRKVLKNNRFSFKILEQSTVQEPPSLEQLTAQGCRAPCAVRVSFFA